MTKRTEVIGVRVTPDEKQEFEDHLEDTNEFQSLSKLFRNATLEHISNYGDEETASIDPEEIVNAVETGLSGVNERLENLDNRMAEMESQVSNDDEIDKLARELYQSLPELEEGMEMLNPRNIDSAGDELRMAQQLGTENAWADYFDVEIAQMGRAIARAQEYYPDIEIEESPNMQRRIYREVPATGDN